jgi:hypothetical protein
MNSEKGDGFRLKIPQLVAGLFIWAMVGCLIWFTLDLPYFQEGAPGPRFMPVVLAVFLGILNTLYWIDAFFFRSQAKITLPRPSQLIRPAGFALIGLFMILLWERLGVVPTVWVSSFLELKLIEKYSWTRSLLVGLLLSLSTWALFQLLLGIPLPKGVFEGLPFL